MRRIGIGIGQLDGPVLGVLAGIDFEKPSAIETANEAVLAPADAELAVARAHESFAFPLGAALIHRIDIIIFRRQWSAHQGLAALRFEIPPSLAHPNGAIGIGDGHADPIGRRIAKPKIGSCRNGGKAQDCRGESAED